MLEAALLITSIIFLILCLLLYSKWREQQHIIHDLKLEHPDWRVGFEQGEGLLTEAELEALRLVTEKKTELALFEKRFNDRLQQVMQSLAEQLQESVNRIEKNYQQNLDQTKVSHGQFFASLQKNVTNFQVEAQKQMRAKINELLLNFETNLTNFFTKAEQQSLDSINLELRSARQLIDSYKSQQLSIVDENIVAILERTLSLVLKEKLSLKDQIDLVYQALEKAKIEKFLI